MTPGRFGLLFSRTITGNVYGQPLYVGGVDFGGGVQAQRGLRRDRAQHDLRVRRGSAGCDAADAPLWSRMLGSPLAAWGARLTSRSAPTCATEVGITSTPVISLADNKIYVVAKVPGDQAAARAGSRDRRRRCRLAGLGRKDGDDGVRSA